MMVWKIDGLSSLMSEVFRQYNSLAIEQKRSIQTWRPVVIEVLHSLSELEEEQVSFRVMMNR